MPVQRKRGRPRKVVEEVDDEPEIIENTEDVDEENDAREEEQQDSNDDQNDEEEGSDDEPEAVSLSSSKSSVLQQKKLEKESRKRAIEDKKAWMRKISGPKKTKFDDDEEGNEISEEHISLDDGEDIDFDEEEGEDEEEDEEEDEITVKSNIIKFDNVEVKVLPKGANKWDINQIKDTSAEKRASAMDFLTNHLYGGNVKRMDGNLFRDRKQKQAAPASAFKLTPSKKKSAAKSKVAS